MGKLKFNKRNSAAAGSSPYFKAQTTTNNVFKFNTNVGQHILKNPGVAEAIVAKANLKPSVVLEVGSGTGNLTVRILEKAKKVIAVELDPRMAAEVTKRVLGKPEQKRLEVLLGDVIKTELPHFDVCISNTPYQACLRLKRGGRIRANVNGRSPVLWSSNSLPCPIRPEPPFSCFSGSSHFDLNSQFWAKITHIMKVGKNNFRPPPQVESSVVRIEPKQGTERPGVSWDEWDGMLRICFVRKNRTMRASWLGTKEVLAMVERNYRVWCAMNNVTVDDTVVGEEEEMEIDEGAGAGEEDEWGRIMEVNEEADDTPSFFKEEAERLSKANGAKTKSKKKKTRVAELVREKIRKVLEDDTELADQRAAKCDENDFLRLLSAFNEEGIHFA